MTHTFVTLPVSKSTWNEVAGKLLDAGYDHVFVEETMADMYGIALCLDDLDIRPKIVCLCGSTKFKEAFDEANYQETMAGNIILSVGFYMHACGNKHGEGVGATVEQKMKLDELHKRKIDLCDEILVLNVGGYIGDSTKSEIAYAQTSGKDVRWLEPQKIS